MFLDDNTLYMIWKGTLGVLNTKILQKIWQILQYCQENHLKYHNTSLSLITNVMPKPSLCTLHLEQMTDITNKLEFVNGNSIRYFF